MDHQRLLLDHLDLIDQIVRTTARRRHLSGVETDDFAGFVSLRLVEDNYAILRKFQNRSSLWTYLVAVIERASLDFCAERWGKWRPSAKAVSLGTSAAVLERLVERDGYTVEEAIAIMRTNLGVADDERTLRGFWEQLPARARLTPVDEEAAETVIDPVGADAGVDAQQHQARVDDLRQALQGGLEGLAKQDRVMLALKFNESLTAGEIAQVTNTSVPTVHRRLDRSLKQLQQALLDAGFKPREISALIGHPTIAISPLLRAEVESFSRHVRLSKRDG